MADIRLTVGQAVVKFLDNQYVAAEIDGVMTETKFVEGFYTIFGHGCVLGIGEALSMEKHTLKVYQGKNEQGMALAAASYAKTHNRLKIIPCVSSIGPGSANMVTAAATATVNNLPLLLFMGDSFASRQPDPVLQQVEQTYNPTVTTTDAFRAVTRFFDKVTRPEMIMTSLLNAMRVLTDPAECGAAAIAISQDVQGESYLYPESFFEKRVHLIRRRRPEPYELEKACEVIKASSFPLVIAGGGVRYSFAGNALKKFCLNHNIPFAETQAGKSAVESCCPLNLGGIGVTGNACANTVAAKADLIIGVGTRFSDFTTSSKWLYSDAKVVTVNVSPFHAAKLDAVTVIGDAVKLIRQQHGVDIDIDAIPLDDQETCKLLTEGDTAGVFQMESSGITTLVKELAPKHFEDMIPLVALYRPGPLGSGMVEDFIKGSHGEKEITYLHPLLEPILKDTYGVILYQEQVMQIASVMGGFSLGQADLLRRAMGKKKESILKAQRESFLAGTQKNGISDDIANKVFDLMVYFAGYGFNKSHSAAYAYIAWQTAYLKTHYRAEFMAATMTSFINDIRKISYYISECRRHGVEVLAPDVNASVSMFSVENGAIRFGLSAVKSISDVVIEAIVTSREKDGPFTSLSDFCSRVDYHILNRKMLESLIKGGSMDSFGRPRSQLIAVLEEAMSVGAQKQKDDASGQMGLFDDGNDTAAMELVYPNAPEYPMDMLLAMEKEYDGFYFSGHPLEKYEDVLKSMTPLSVLFGEDNRQYDGKMLCIGGLVTGRRQVTTKRNEQMVILTIEDYTGSIPVVVFPKAFSQYMNLCVVDMAVSVQGRADINDDDIQLIAETLAPLGDQPAEGHAVSMAAAARRAGALWQPGKGTKLFIKIPAHLERSDLSTRLGGVLEKHHGDVKVYFHLMGSRRTILTDPRYWVETEDSLRQELEAMLEPGSVVLK